MNETAFVTSPDFPKAAQTSQAYLQRWVVVLLAIACTTFSAYDFRKGCWILKLDITGNEVNENEKLSNVTDAVDGFLDALGSGVGDTQIVYDENSLKGLSGFLLGSQRFTTVDLNNDHSVCYKYTDSETGFDMQFTERGTKFRTVASAFGKLAPALGLLGVLCALVEFFFCVFYPSVVAASFFFAGAAIADGVMLLMMMLEMLDWWRQSMLHLSFGFWVHCFVMGGYFFCSCLVLFGLRTYPWCMRKNRDPRHCKTIEAEIIDPETLVALAAKRTKEGEEEEIADAGHFVSIEAHQQLEQELADTKQKLSESLKALEEANGSPDIGTANVNETKQKLSQSLKELKETIARDNKTDTDTLVLANEVMNTVSKLLK